MLAQQNNCGKIMNIIAVCINIICVRAVRGGKGRFESGTLTVARLNVWLQHRTSATCRNVRNRRNIERLQRADHNWIPQYCEMNFIMRLSVRGRRYPVTLMQVTIGLYTTQQVIVSNLLLSCTLEANDTLQVSCSIATMKGNCTRICFCVVHLIVILTKAQYGVV